MIPRTNPPSPRRAPLSRLLSTLALVCGACQSAPSSQPEPPPAPPLRVLTYNIHHGEGIDGQLDLARIADVVLDARADLVALQEVDRVAERTGGVDQLEELARLTGLHPAFAKFMDFEGGEYGLAILSRYEIEAAWPIELPPGLQEPRSALAVTVHPPGLGATTFVCLHLDWLAPDAQRFAQAQSLIAALSALPAPVLLAGDFNDQPESRTLRLFGRDYSSAAKPDSASFTFPSFEPEREIDFVMFRKSRTLGGTARVLPESVASDHRPVLAELRRL